MTGKFRAWDKAKKCYIDSEKFVEQLFVNSRGRVIWWSHAGLEDITDNIDIEWETGACDKNGKVIYQGDNCRFGRKVKNRNVGELIYEQDFCAFGCWQKSSRIPHFHFCYEDFEIISTIHDEGSE